MQTKNEDDQQLRWPKMKTTNKSTAMLVYVCFAAFFVNISIILATWHEDFFQQLLFIVVAYAQQLHEDMGSALFKLTTMESFPSWLRAGLL